jgi:hypothetical protein
MTIIIIISAAFNFHVIVLDLNDGNLQLDTPAPYNHQQKRMAIKSKIPFAFHYLPCGHDRDCW